MALRNERGVVGHGKDGFLDALESDHLRSFLFVGDAICGLLLAAYQNVEPNLSFTREPFDRFQRKSALLDRAVAITAEVEATDDAIPYLVVELRVGPGQVPTTLRIEPSRLLFHVERDAYVDLLSQSQLLDDQERVSTAEEEEAALVETVGPSSVSVDVETRRIIAPSKREYRGTLDPIRNDFAALLTPLNLPAEEHNRLIENLLTEAENDMGPDWRVRDSLQASTRVAFAAAMRQEGIQAQRAKQEAARLQRWLSESGTVKELETQGEA